MFDSYMFLIRNFSVSVLRTYYIMDAVKFLSQYAIFRGLQKKRLAARSWKFSNTEKKFAQTVKKVFPTICNQKM